VLLLTVVVFVSMNVMSVSASSIRPGENGLSSPQVDESIDWEMIPDPRVEAEVLAQGEKTPQNVPDAPRLFWDEDLGRCYISTNIPWDILQAAGISLEGSSIEERIPNAPRFEDVYDRIQRIQSLSNAKYPRTLLYDPVVVIWVTVPAIWSTGEDIEIKFKMFNEGYQTATASCHFYGYDNSTGSDEVEFSVSGSVNIPGESYGYKTLTVEIPEESVGIKRGIATATEDASYSEDMGYVFVQKFGELDASDLPEDDRMSYTSGNDNYYWEGLSDIDGFNVQVNYSRYHPYAWNITWLAGCLIDTENVSTIDNAAEYLTNATNQKMTYDSKDDGIIDYSHSSHWSDFKIMSENFTGVCDEFACLEVSFLRSLGIPCRQIGGSRQGGGHSWLEYWGQLNGDWSWIHADPTWNKYNLPAGIKNLNYTNINLYSYWNDSSYSGGTIDGNSTNRRLVKNDAKYSVSYDGPNDFGYAFIDICEDTLSWTYDGSWPNPIFSIGTGTLYTSNGYLRAVPTNQDGTGPFYYRELDNALDIYDFRKLEIEVSFNNPSDSYKGCFAVALYDYYKEFICYVILYEWRGAQVDMDFYTRWYLDNGTTSNYNEFDYQGASWRGIIEIYRNETSGPYGNYSGGIWSYIEGFGYQQLFSESDIQGDQREICYIGIQWRRGSDTFLNYYLHDVRVWEFTR